MLIRHLRFLFGIHFEIFDVNWKRAKYFLHVFKAKLRYIFAQFFFLRYSAYTLEYTKQQNMEKLRDCFEDKRGEKNEII